MHGVELHRIRIIDWEEDPIVIYWNNNTKSSPDPLTGKWSEIPSPRNGIPAPGGAARLALQGAGEVAKQKRPTFVPRGSYK